MFDPGDFCEPFGAVPPFMDYTMAALTTGKIGFMTPRAIRGRRPIEPADRAGSLVGPAPAQALGREHKFSLGRRLATEWLGLFFCENTHG